MNQPAIEARSLTHRFGNLCALNQVDLSIPAGRIVALLGPNGAGKTTLMRLCLGLIKPTDGHIRILGQDARALPAADCPRVISVGEGQDPPRWATLRNLMKLQACASPLFDKSKYTALLDEAELSQGMEFGSLSKGQKRWVLSSLALASGADVLVLDEPVDGLDPNARRRLYDHLRDYASDRQASVLVATHILGDIERVADDTVILHKGQVLLHDELETIREKVRQITLDKDVPVDSLCDYGQLLAIREERHVTQAWLRLADSYEAAEALRDLDVSAVNLESLYLGLTENSAAQPAERDEEVAA